MSFGWKHNESEDVSRRLKSFKNVFKCFAPAAKTSTKTFKISTNTHTYTHKHESNVETQDAKVVRKDTRLISKLPSSGRLKRKRLNLSCRR